MSSPLGAEGIGLKSPTPTNARSAELPGRIWLRAALVVMETFGTGLIPRPKRQKDKNYVLPAFTFAHRALCAAAIRRCAVAERNLLRRRAPLGEATPRDASIAPEKRSDTPELPVFEHESELHSSMQMNFAGFKLRQ
jgi:hypothetical protein